MNDTLELYRNRIVNHIARVKHFYLKLIDARLIPDADKNISEVMKHDDDKLEPENMRKQALRFSNGGNIDAADMSIINDVIRKHIKSNPHHCEYWAKPNEDHLSVGIHCETMPDKYIYEMMADWAATAEERGSKIIDWYKKCVGARWYFSRHQQELMLNCIAYLDTKLDNSYQANYNMNYVDPALAKLSTIK